MVASLQRLVAAVEKKEEQEAVTGACQDSLAHLHYLLGDEVEEQLEGPWLALVIATMVTLQSRVKSDEAGDYRRALCQAWLLALLSIATPTKPSTPPEKLLQTVSLFLSIDLFTRYLREWIFKRW